MFAKVENLDDQGSRLRHSLSMRCCAQVGDVNFVSMTFAMPRTPMMLATMLGAKYPRIGTTPVSTPKKPIGFRLVVRQGHEQHPHRVADHLDHAVHLPAQATVVRM